MDDTTMRKELRDAYPGSDSWASKVDKMSPAQVFAIHTRMNSKGQLNK